MHRSFTGQEDTGQRSDALEEAGMQWRVHWKSLINACAIAVSLCLVSPVAQGQQGRVLLASSPQPAEMSSDVRALAELVRDLQTQVQTLNSELSDLRTE